MTSESESKARIEVRAPVRQWDVYHSHSPDETPRAYDDATITTSRAHVLRTATYRVLINEADFFMWQTSDGELHCYIRWQHE